MSGAAGPSQGDPNRTALGPRRRVARELGRGWRVIADELLLPTNALTWDVYLEHERPLPDCPRIPAGENPHAEPWEEMTRLSAIVCQP